jgi:hypothetical protein
LWFTLSICTAWIWIARSRWLNHIRFDYKTIIATLSISF